MKTARSTADNSSIHGSWIWAALGYNKCMCLLLLVRRSMRDSHGICHLVAVCKILAYFAPSWFDFVCFVSFRLYFTVKLSAGYVKEASCSFLGSISLPLNRSVFRGIPEIFLLWVLLIPEPAN